MIRTIIVDDEKPSREVLYNYLKEFCPEVEIVASASSVKTAYKSIKKNKPDIVFLDIEMADGKGFDLLKMFESIDFKVIFVTAYSDYALNAFRVNAIDYLLKPIKIEELQAAVEKVKVVKNDKNLYLEDIDFLVKGLSKEIKDQNTIAITHLKGFEVLKICEIIICCADSYCTIFYLTGKRKVTSSKNLKHFEELLTPHKFLRVHHSYLINLKHVCSYTNQGEIVLTDNNKAFLGEKYKQLFISKFKAR
jgi:two-component system, LytTR family, response regulator